VLPSAAPPPLLELTLRPDLDVLLGRWQYQPATAAELLPCYQQLAEMALATNCRFWLQDLRRRTSPDEQTKQWLLTEYYAGVAHRFGKPLFVAYLFSPSMHRLIVEAPDYAPPEAYFDKSYLLDFFGDEGAAIRWLQQRQELGVG
jgi:hypothetical protein